MVDREPWILLGSGLVHVRAFEFSAASARLQTAAVDAMTVVWSVSVKLGERPASAG
jgi:hypothetical protein